VYSRQAGYTVVIGGSSSGSSDWMAASRRASSRVEAEFSRAESTEDWISGSQPEARNTEPPRLIAATVFGIIGFDVALSAPWRHFLGRVDVDRPPVGRIEVAEDRSRLARRDPLNLQVITKVSARKPRRTTGTGWATVLMLSTSAK
jgi:hypothetical protein